MQAPAGYHRVMPMTSDRRLDASALDVRDAARLWFPADRYGQVVPVGALATVASPLPHTMNVPVAVLAYR